MEIAKHAKLAFFTHDLSDKYSVPKWSANHKRSHLLFSLKGWNPPNPSTFPLQTEPSSSKDEEERKKGLLRKLPWIPRLTSCLW